MQPPRHALGALLLEQGEVAEAATVFAADLAAHPGGNIWALHGLAECEERGAPIVLPTPPTESEANAALSLAEPASGSASCSLDSSAACSAFSDCRSERLRLVLGIVEVCLLPPGTGDRNPPAE